MNENTFFSLFFILFIGKLKYKTQKDPPKTKTKTQNNLDIKKMN